MLVPKIQKQKIKQTIVAKVRIKVAKAKVVRIKHHLIKRV